MNWFLLWTMAAAASALGADPFGAAKVGELPEGWIAGATGEGSPHWAAVKDDKATVLEQSGSATFPWCVSPKLKAADGTAEVGIRLLSGKEDQAGGIVWRWKDTDNYYIARINALEDTAAFFVMSKGKRRMLKNIDMKITAQVWHDFKVEFKGGHAAAFLDGKRVLEMDNDEIGDEGATGVWTKADSVTRFRDFRFTKAR